MARAPQVSACVGPKKLPIFVEELQNRSIAAVRILMHLETLSSFQGPFERVGAHTNVLATKSDYFDRQFYGEFGRPTEVRVEDANADVFRAVIK